MNEHSHRKAQALIQSGVNLTLEERSWLQAHLKTCQDCRVYASIHAELSVGLPLVYAKAPLSSYAVYDRLERIQARLGSSAKLAGLFHLSRGVIFAAGALAFVLILLAVVPGLLPDPQPLPLTDATLSPRPAATTPSQTPELDVTKLPIALPIEATTLPTIVPTEAPGLPLSQSPFLAVSQLGGSIRGIVVQGDIAFVGMGPRVAAIDLSNHFVPQVLGAGPPFQGMVNALVPNPGDPNTMIVAAGKCLVVVDVFDPANILPLHLLELPGGIITLALDTENHILYAGGETTSSPSRSRYYVVAVRVGPGGALELRDQVSVDHHVTSLAVGEGVLYLGSDQTSVGVYAMPLDQPGALSAPRGVIASSPEVYRAGYRLHATRDRLYVGSYEALFAYDISDPLKPVELWKVPAMMAMDFVFDGDRALLYGWLPAGSFLSYHRGVTLPEPYQGSALGINSSDVALHRGRLVVAHYQLGVFDTLSEEESTLIGSYRSPLDGILGAVSDDNHAYVVSEGMPGAVNDFTLHVLRLPDLFPLSQTTIPNPGAWGGVDWFRGITQEGERLYVAGIDGVTIFNTSTIAPTRLGFLPVGNLEAYLYLQAIAAVEQGGQRLLFTAHTSSGDSTALTVYDLTSPSTPAQIGQPLLLSNETVGRMLVEPGGGRLYFSSTIGPDSYLSLARLDGSAITAGAKMRLDSHPMAFAARGERLLVGTSEELIVFSTAGTGDLERLGSLPLPGNARGILLLDNRALVHAWGSAGQDVLIEVDLSDPTNPLVLTQLDVPFSSGMLNHWQSGLRYLVLAGYSSGVEVLEKSRD